MLSGFGLATPIRVAEALGDAALGAEIPDTRRQADLVAALANAPPETVLVGARGLAQALAGAGQPAALPALTPPLMIAVGSTDPITLEQVAARSRARSDLHRIPAPAGAVPDGAALAPLTLVQAVPGVARPSAEVAAAFARGIAALAEGAASLVVTGGATAEAMLDALGFACLEVLGEALPGMPLIRAGGLTIATKSGGFGTPSALVRLAAPQRAPALAATRGA
jgi:D-threonate/D-erythronate kinase